MDSPIAKALHKKGINDEVRVETNEKTIILTVLSIRYESQE
jgi:transcription elongation GreA/GreB family factor